MLLPLPIVSILFYFSSRDRTASTVDWLAPRMTETISDFDNGIMPPQ